MTNMTKIKSAISYIFLGVLSFLSVFPFYWLLVCATNTSNDISKGKLLPGKALADNFKAVMERTDLLLCLRNSVIVTLFTVTLCILFSSMAGYAFEIFRNKKRDKLFNIMLLGMMIPTMTTIVPLYKLTASMKLVNTLTGIILPGMLSVWHMFLFRQTTKSFPYELVEAARIDGMNEFSIYCRIYLPLIRSTVATGFVMAFMNSWNNFAWPRLILMQDTKMTLPIIIANLQSGYTPNYGAIMLACCVCTVPTLIIFLCMQKSFSNGITGSLKG